MGEPLPRGAEYWTLITALGTAWDALWDGLKRAITPMFIGLGTVGRLPEGVYGYAPKS